jgi:hypothetical protein
MTANVPPRESQPSSKDTVPATGADNPARSPHFWPHSRQRRDLDIRSLLTPVWLKKTIGVRELLAKPK